MQHGLLGCSSNWLDNLANESLAYLLADHGADVWLGNVRGRNTYPKNHTTLKPDEDKFWDWRFGAAADNTIEHTVTETDASSLHTWQMIQMTDDSFPAHLPHRPPQPH